MSKECPEPPWVFVDQVIQENEEETPHATDNHNAYDMLCPANSYCELLVSNSSRGITGAKQLSAFVEDAEDEYCEPEIVFSLWPHL